MMGVELERDMPPEGGLVCAVALLGLVFLAGLLFVCLDFMIRAAV